MLILVWYCFFGLMVVPWRLIRRGHRREKQQKLRHQELLDQQMVLQQQLAAQQQDQASTAP